uniref:Uncharacterized protein n=1 Tax=Rhizophora mucronata TaxID=61149 RepID=A0A2P2PYN9_RHIMU
MRMTLRGDKEEKRKKERATKFPVILLGLNYRLGKQSATHVA